MKHCPECGGARRYRLADGGCKRRARGRRLSGTSIEVRCVCSSGSSIACGLCLSSVRLAVDRALAMKQSHGTWALLPRACCAQAGQLRAPLEGASVCRCPWGGAGKAERGWGAPDKAIVLAHQIKRHGGVRAMPIPAHERAWGMRQIQAHTRERERHTDEWKACAPRKPYGGR